MPSSNMAVVSVVGDTRRNSSDRKWSLTASTTTTISSAHNSDHLLSFDDSWDYDGTPTTIPATSSNNDAAHPLQENRANTHHNFSHFNHIENKNSKLPISSSSEPGVIVDVSGSEFVVPINIFERLTNLPWQQVHDPRKHRDVPGGQGECLVEGRFHLATAPHLFEIILNFLLFGAYPKYKSLADTDIEELEPLLLVLEMNELLMHLEKKKWSGIGGGGGRSMNSNRKTKSMSSKPYYSSTGHPQMICNQQLSITTTTVDTCSTIHQTPSEVESASYSLQSPSTFKQSELLGKKRYNNRASSKSTGLERSPFAHKARLWTKSLFQRGTRIDRRNSHARRIHQSDQQHAEWCASHSDLIN